MRASAFIAAASCTLALSACASGGTSPSAYGPTGTASRRESADWATIQVGDYRLENNVWNKGVARGPYNQSVFAETLDGAEAFGWTWNWPNAGGNVVSYPEVGYGYSPWGMSSWGGSPAIPAKIGAKAITASFDMKSSMRGSYDLAFDIWVTGPTATPTSADIRYEIMIWLDHKGLSPAGRKLASGLSIGGVDYDLWEMRGMQNGTTATWTYFAYVADAPVYSGSVDISGIFADLVDARGVSSSLYIASIELGNEVVTGSGVTEIKDWSIGVR